MPFVPETPGPPSSPSQPSNLTFTRYPANLGQPPVDKWILFEAKSGRHVIRDVIPESSGADRTIASVGLYLTETALRDQLMIAWDQSDTGPFMGALVELLARTGQNLFDLKLDTINQTREGLQSKLKSALGGNAGSALPDGIAGALGDSFLEMLKADAYKGLVNLAGDGAIGALTGQKPNPRTNVYFNTQQYRQHNFDFLLVPRNLQEAQAIDRIVNFFQFYSLPSYRENATQNLKVGAFMMGYPYEFEVSFLDGSGRILNHVNRVGRCVLKDIVVDHAGGGKTAFVKQNDEFYPVATRLTLSFQEVILLGRERQEIQRAGAIDPNDDRFDPRR